MKKRRPGRGGYCLVTPAHNESGYIARTMDAVIAQTAPPLRWVIVDDASDDDTVRVAEERARNMPFVSVVRIASRGTGRAGAGFASKVLAFERGCEELSGLGHGFVGNLDADVTFGPRLFEGLLEEFDRDPRLGCAGGWIREPCGVGPRARFGNSERDVAGALQLFRRECLDEIGGFAPLACGGEDAAAQAAARMRGWRVRAFPRLAIDHHRPTPRGIAAGGTARFREGVRDRALGYHPLFEVFKCARRALERPYVIGAAARLMGYAWSCLEGGGAGVSPEIANFIRREQLRRMRSLLVRRAAGTEHWR